MFFGSTAETDYDPAVRTSVSVYDMAGDVSTVDLSIGRRREFASAALSPAEARDLSAWLLTAAEYCEKVRAEPPAGASSRPAE
jgi:hypothetical protein